MLYQYFLFFLKEANGYNTNPSHKFTSEIKLSNFSPIISSYIDIEFIYKFIERCPTAINAINYISKQL